MKEVVKEEEEVRARYHETNIQLLKKKNQEKVTTYVHKKNTCTYINICTVSRLYDQKYSNFEIG